MSFYPLSYLAHLVDCGDTNIWRFKSASAAVCVSALPWTRKKDEADVTQLHSQCSITTEPRD